MCHTLHNPVGRDVAALWMRSWSGEKRNWCFTSEHSTPIEPAIGNVCHPQSTLDSHGTQMRYCSFGGKSHKTERARRRIVFAWALLLSKPTIEFRFSCPVSFRGDKNGMSKPQKRFPMGTCSEIDSAEEAIGATDQKGILLLGATALLRRAVSSRQKA
jgi:hypothetical protein